jgi:hypothetical protein
VSPTEVSRNETLFLGRSVTATRKKHLGFFRVPCWPHGEPRLRQPNPRHVLHQVSQAFRLYSPSQHNVSPYPPPPRLQLGIVCTGTHRPQDTSSKGRIVQEQTFGNTAVRIGLIFRQREEQTTKKACLLPLFDILWPTL